MVNTRILHSDIIHELLNSETTMDTASESRTSHWTGSGCSLFVPLMETLNVLTATALSVLYLLIYQISHAEAEFNMQL